MRRKARAAWMIDSVRAVADVIAPCAAEYEAARKAL
jgi:hypothetical protein